MRFSWAGAEARERRSLPRSGAQPGTPFRPPDSKDASGGLRGHAPNPTGGLETARGGTPEFFCGEPSRVQSVDDPGIGSYPVMTE